MFSKREMTNFSQDLQGEILKHRRMDLIRHIYNLDISIEWRQNVEINNEKKGGGGEPERERKERE